MTLLHDTREPPMVRPPGQTSMSDLNEGGKSIQSLRTPELTAPTPESSRTQSIQRLVAQLGTGHANPPATSANSPRSTMAHPHHPHHVAPIIPATSDFNQGQSSPNYGMDELNKSANHDAIVKHFQLRRVVEDEGQNFAHDDGDDDDDTEADLTKPYAQRMINAAKIREFRRMKSRHDSTTSSVAQMVIPVSKRRCLRWQRRFTRRLRSFAHACIVPFSPIEAFSKARGVVLLLVMLVQLFIIPFQPVYFPSGTKAMDGLNFFFDIAYIIDFIANCNTAYFNRPDELEFSRRKIITRYVRSGWPFWVDLLTSIPVDTIVTMCIRGDAGLSHFDFAGYVMIAEVHSIFRFFSWASFLRSIWFMRVVRATKEFWFRLIYSRLSYGVAVAKVVLLLLFVTHYVACFLRYSKLTMMTDHEKRHPWKLYTSDAYSAAQLLQGQGQSVDTVSQSIYGIIAVLVGYLVIAFITGSIGLILLNYNSNTSLYQRKLESVFATMDKMQLPPQLRHRIHEYYNHLWFEHDSIDGDIAKFSHELSRSLGLEVRLFKYMDLVLSVPYWRNSSADFVTQIMLSLDVRAYLPEDYIVRQGEIGDGLYLINRGICELTSCPADQQDGDSAPPLARHSVKTASTSTAAEGAVNVRRLMAGHSFGELALLMNYRRTADVRAASYVEICVLGRSCFQKLLLRYREDRRDVLRELVLSCMEKSGMRFIAFPWEDMVDRILRSGIHHNLEATSHTQLTPWETAELIVDLITPDAVADSTVTFGFHDFDTLSNFQLVPVTIDDPGLVRQSSRRRLSRDRTFSGCRCPNSSQALSQHHELMERVASLEALIGDLVSELRKRG